MEGHTPTVSFLCPSSSDFLVKFGRLVFSAWVKQTATFPIKLNKPEDFCVMYNLSAASSSLETCHFTCLHEFRCFAGEVESCFQNSLLVSKASHR